MDTRNRSEAPAARRSAVWGRIVGLLRQWDATPRQLTGIYLVIGLVGLYASDVLLVRALSDPTLRRVQAVKGVVEVVLTAGLVYALTVKSRTVLERSNAALDRRNEELQVLHRVLRHNLRNDLNVILGRAADLDDHVESPDGSRHLEAIVARADALAGYTGHAHRIRKLTEETGLTTFELRDCVNAVLADHPSLHGGVTVVRRGLDGPTVTVRAHPLLPSAIAELVTNAVEYSDGPDCRLELWVDRESGSPNTVALVVSDDGPGIPPAERGVLEDGSEDELAHCTGLGLWFVRWTVARSGGEISVDVDDRGTAITVSLPTTAAPEGRTGGTARELQNRPPTG